MKYIRTKDGIYEIDALSIHYIGETHFSCWDKKHTKTFNKWHIIKQADTIEELCDEFVVKIKTGYLITYYDKKLLTQDANKNGADVYGAIWTDKGLIYVAKMNNKGELELL